MAKLMLSLLLVVTLAAACALPGPSAPADNPPVINFFNADPTTISAGQYSTLAWDVTGASSISIDHNIGSVAQSGSRDVNPTSTTIYTLTATNNAGISVTATATVTIAEKPDSAVMKLFVTVYDFVDRARDASWSSGLQGGPLPAGVRFGGNCGSDNSGCAAYRTDIKMEDGKNYGRVLETHPKWVDNGYIYGWYRNIEVEEGTQISAKVGLLQGANQGNVVFAVTGYEVNTKAKVVDQRLADSYDSSLKTIKCAVPAGQHDFYLRVEANGPSTQDWAAWVEAKLIRAR